MSSWSPPPKEKSAAEEILHRLDVGGPDPAVRIGHRDGQPDQAGKEIDLCLGNGVGAGAPSVSRGQPRRGGGSEELPLLRRTVEQVPDESPENRAQGARDRADESAQELSR